MNQRVSSTHSGSTRVGTATSIRSYQNVHEDGCFVYRSGQVCVCMT